MHNKNNCSLGVVCGKEISAKITKNIKEMVETKRQEITKIIHSENEKRKKIIDDTQKCISEIEKRKNERIESIQVEHQKKMEKLKDLQAQLKIAIEKKDEEEISRIMKQLY